MLLTSKEYLEGHVFIKIFLFCLKSNILNFIFGGLDPQEFQKLRIDQTICVIQIEME